MRFQMLYYIDCITTTLFIKLNNRFIITLLSLKSQISNATQVLIDLNCT